MTDTLQIFPSGNLETFQRQVVGVGPNGLNIFGAAGTTKPQSAIWAQYGEMYEYYNVDSFSCQWIPNKFEFIRDTNNPAETGETTIAAPCFQCLDPDDEKPLTPSTILSYNTARVHPPYKQAHFKVPNYKALAVQKQEKTLLKTGSGIVGNEEVYENACNIVTWIQNPRRGGSNGSAPLGWMMFTVSYTFAGLKRPGAALQEKQDPQHTQIAVKEDIKLAACQPQPPEPGKLQLTDQEIAFLHQ